MAVMAWKVLITAPYMQPAIERFRPVFVENNIELLVPPVKERLGEAELMEWVADIDGAICGDDSFTARVLATAPRLKVISKWGTGIDSIDQAECQRRGIAVRNTPNAFSEPVADSVLGYMLCFARNLFQMDLFMKQGVWEKIPGVTLRERTLGVIGVGNAGKAVVRRAATFGMRLMGNDIVQMPADFIAETGIEMVAKESLLRQADFISLNCDLNPTSFHLLSEKEFSLMKPTAILINTARGPVVDESALIRALQDKRIAGAALDVFEEEPLPVNSPLCAMDNVLLAPHNANSSPEAWEQVHRRTIANLLEELRKHHR
ncbi:MAG: dihydrofolate reductase [Deltaproteobacteria bacterium]|nr:MAG: dihydrofolate reductase [Deltaproteobacteria bacterium]